jgi:hypothetical protein
MNDIDNLLTEYLFIILIFIWQIACFIFASNNILIIISYTYYFHLYMIRFLENSIVLSHRSIDLIFI